MRTSPVKAAMVYGAVVVFVGAFILGYAGHLPAADSSPVPDPKPQVVYVVSPWNGMFRAGEFSGGPPYVEEGSRVEPGTIVGVIEPVTAVPMESFVVPAGVSGTITKVLVSDSEMVWVGQPLFQVQLDVPVPVPEPMRE